MVPTCNYNGLEYNPSDPKFENLSKRGIKKLLKHELWESTKDEKRLALREKTKLKRSEKRQKVKDGLVEPTPTKKKLAFLSELTQVGLIMDCGFNNLMEEKVNTLTYTTRTNSPPYKSGIILVDQSNWVCLR